MPIEATNSAIDATIVATLVQRLRSTHRISGSYSRTQKEFFGSPVSSTLPFTRPSRR